MTASVRVDGKARSDVRFTYLGQLLGTGRHDALGKMVDVWGYCTDNQTYLASGDILAMIAGVEHFGWYMVKADLAVFEGPVDDAGVAIEDEEVFRVRGTEGRIEWLARLRDNAKRGGAANRARFAMPMPSHLPSHLAIDKPRELNAARAKVEPEGYPSESPLIPVLVPVPSTSAEGEPGKPARKMVPGYPEFVARFDELYRQATGGSKPTWGKKQGAMVNRILRSHGLAECIRRAEILFTAPPAFLTETTPDLGALVAFFDRLDRPSGPIQRRLSQPSGSTPEHAIVLAKPPVAEDPVDSAEALALVDRLKRGLGGSRTADQGSEAPATPPTVQKRHTEAP